jgi:hypothetical protein
MGLMVVLARKNEMIPARSKKTPTTASAVAEAKRIDDGSSNDGAINETPHMAPAMISATTGGGIKSSSAAMRLT